MTVRDSLKDSLSRSDDVAQRHGPGPGPKETIPWAVQTLLPFHSDCSHERSLPGRWLLKKQHYLKGLPPPRPFMPETASSILQRSRLEPEFLSPCNMSSARIPVQWLGNNVCDNHLATSRFSKKMSAFLFSLTITQFQIEHSHAIKNNFMQ